MPRVPSVRKIAVSVLVAAAVVAAGAWGFHAFRTWKLAALFAGPAEQVRDTRAGFYAKSTYDLSAFLSTPDSEDNTPREEDDISALRPRKPEDGYDYVDGAGRDVLEAKMKRAKSVDASSGATRVVRLESPTTWRERWAPRVLTITDPVDNALFPPNLCAPFVEWADPVNDLWQVEVRLPGTSIDFTGLSEERRWRFPDKLWADVVACAGGDPVTVRVKGVRRAGLWSKSRESVHVSQPVRFYISKDPADGAVVYRLVEPPFATRKAPDTFVRDVREKDHRLFLAGRKEYCFNCHTFSSKSGRTGWLGLQVRYLGQAPSDHRVYFSVFDMEGGRAVNTVLPFEIQMTTFMAWSPDGTKLAYSANQQIVAFSPITLDTQNAGQATSDIAVYDTTKGRTWLIPGASDPDLLELYPAWTPDGKSIVYSCAKAGAHPSLIRYDLWVVPYNDGKGGAARPIPGASANGRSNYFARFSPDGKWLSFVQSDGGDLMKSSSDICILPANLRGEAHLLEGNSPFAADSWHSWSSNSKWLVFASKRDDGIFARLYFTHIDERGHASPPVRLPVTDPPMLSFNIPEFLAEPPAFDEPTLFNAVNVGQPAVRIKRAEREKK